MSSQALNQVYKSAIMAIEEAQVTGSLDAGDTSIDVAGKFMTQSPFKIGDESSYVLRDDSFAPGVNGLPNAEKITIASISNEVITPLSDGIGYDYSATLSINGYTSTGWSGGLANSYKSANHPTILLPGVEMAIQSADFNCRFKTMADAPKIEFDDEASRFAAGDEGRDKSIAGARSGDIDFTEKVSWAGNVYTVPNYGKLMRAMGHVIRKWEAGKSVVPSTYATLSTLASGESLVVAERFFTVDGTDVTNGALATAKGSPLAAGDSFIVATLTPAVTVTYTATTYAGVEFLPMTFANEVTATIWIIAPENGYAPSSTIWRYTGGHGGNASNFGAGKIGDVHMLTGKMAAAYIGTMELPLSSVRTMTSMETTVPEVMLSNLLTVPARVNGFDSTRNIEISQYNLDFGGIVNPFLDQSTTTGNAYYATQDRDPKFSCNPYHVRKSLDDTDYIVTNEVTGTITLQTALTNPHITITIANGQLLSPAEASREGYMSLNRVYRCLRNNLGNGSVTAELPDQCMYSILIGARS